MPTAPSGFAFKCNRGIFSIPLAVLSIVILVLSIVTAFESVKYMNSDFFTAKGPILDFSERAFYTIASLTLCAIPAATFGFSAHFVRYNAIAFGFVIFIIAPIIGFAIIGSDIYKLSNAANGGL
jgi:hypothetical protein